MKNWSQCFALCAVVGTLISSALFAGCSRSQVPAPVGPVSNTITDSTGKPIPPGGSPAIPGPASPGGGASGATATDSAGNPIKSSSP